MDLRDKRMECLRMAAELGGNVDAVIAAAQRMLDYVNAAEPAAVKDPPAATSSFETVADPASQKDVAAQIVEIATVEALVADPIAACGTILVIPESGSLGDAVPDPESETDSEAPAVIATGEVLAAPEAALAEFAAEEAHPETQSEVTPAEVAGEKAHAGAVAEVTAAEAADKEAHTEVVSEVAPADVAAKGTHTEAVSEGASGEVTDEEAHAPAVNPAFLSPPSPADQTGEQNAPHA
jgi:hypothetical protein